LKHIKITYDCTDGINEKLEDALQKVAKQFGYKFVEKGEIEYNHSKEWKERQQKLDFFVWGKG